MGQRGPLHPLATMVWYHAPTNFTTCASQPPTLLHHSPSIRRFLTHQHLRLCAGFTSRFIDATRLLANIQHTSWLGTAGTDTTLTRSINYNSIMSATSRTLQTKRSTTTQQRAQHQQRSRQREQLQLNNEAHDLSCVTDAAVDLAADTHIFFSFAHLCCVTVQICSCMNESTTLGIWVPYTYDSLHLHSCPHVDNMTLTDTADKLSQILQFVHYRNEYLFNIATNNQRVYTHKFHSNRAHLHQIKESTKDKSHSYFLQSICIQFATNLFFVTQFYLQSTCI